MGKLFYVIGPHCSGKTTILKTLEANGGIVARGSEIGKDLYYERRFSTAEQGHEFELEVAHKELARDHIYSSIEGIVGVETWHPGNIAYAMVRNPASAGELYKVAEASPAMSGAFGIWLRIPGEVIKDRTLTFADDPEWAADFYGKIDDCLEGILNTMGLLDSTLIVDACQSKEDILREVEAFLSVQGIGAI
ncbi:hypothetical protein SZL87_15145 [Exiguobacterium indicum]|uniref:NadR/Ttd14 AAA domain-containing protein n=1 Tax=Exiguobacterium indicum TaxID=296995 RepID=A0ABU8ELG1_9BACL